jgi:hypothetical protein
MRTKKERKREIFKVKMRKTTRMMYNFKRKDLTRLHYSMNLLLKSKSISSSSNRKEILKLKPQLLLR